jgi:predicted NBD/HSP70 family sugar kinase
MPPRSSLRTTAKSLPEHARGHNRSLVLQTLYSAGAMSRADLARATGLTRVTISDLISELISDNLVVEQGTRDEARPGKPATLVDIDRGGFRILGIDLSGHDAFRGALLDLDGGIHDRVTAPLDGATGEAAVGKVLDVARDLAARATVPILGVGIGSPGVVDLAGIVLTAPNLGWHDLALQDRLSEELGLPTLVANDANVAALAEHSFGDALSDTMLVKIGVVGTDGGEACACGKHGCLETWLAIPRLEARIAAAPGGRDDILSRAGERLGIALAPVVGALDLAEVVLSGPAHLLEGPLARAALDTLRSRTMAELHGDLALRGSALGEDIVMRGAAAMVLSGRLGVS